MIEHDPDLDQLTAACLAAEPRLKLLRWPTRRGIARKARDVAQAMAAEYGPRPDDVYEATLAQVEAAYVDATDRCGNPIVLALIAAIVQLVVLRILQRIWPERQFSLAPRAGSGA